MLTTWPSFDSMVDRPSFDTMVDGSHYTSSSSLHLHPPRVFIGGVKDRAMGGVRV